MNYTEFLKNREFKSNISGHECKTDLSKCFDFQKDIVKWALKLGKACIFADTGLGKTCMQLHWAQDVLRETNKPVLVLAPLAVAMQNAKSSIDDFNIECQYIRENEAVRKTINFTNYELLHKFDLSQFGGVVLDESSILKNYSGKIRNQIIDSFNDMPYKLACTATPSPNDLTELGNHSEFVNIMSRSEMRSMFFLNDSSLVGKWRLKGHAESEFWDWVSQWAVMMSDPADFGYTEQNYKLPPINYHEIVTDKDDMAIFRNETLTLQDRNRVRRDTIESRCHEAANIVNNSDDIFLVWCNLNDESKRLSELIEGAVEVKGSDKDEYKAQSMLEFSDNKIKCLVTKPSIAGMGMNWQNCNKQIFVGLSDSYEQYYQAVRRCYRFGQTKPVDVYIITSEREGEVVENIKRKETTHKKLKQELSKRCKSIMMSNLKGIERQKTNYNPAESMQQPKF